MLKKILASTLLMGTSSLMVMALNLIRVKILAVLLGPEGVGTLTMLNQFHTVIGFFITLGLGDGIIKYVAQYRAENDNASIKNLIANSYLIVFPFSLAVLGLSVLFSERLSVWLTSKPIYASLVIILALAFPLGIYPTLSQYTLQGLKRIKDLARINVYRSVLSITFIVPLVFLFKLKGAVFSAIIIVTIHSILAFYYLRKEGSGFYAPSIRKINFSIIKELFHYGATSLTVETGLNASHLLFKKSIVTALGVAKNGIYQPVWALTMTYLRLVLSSLSTYSYPRLCELKTDKEICDELNGMIRICMLFIVPLMFFLLIAKRPVIHVLYSAKFAEATSYMPIQIMGDFFKVLTYCFSMYLLAQKRLLPFALQGLSQNLFMVMLGMLLVGRFGLHGAALAFSLSYFLAFVVNLAYVKRILHFAFWPKNRSLLLSSFIVLAIVGFSEQFLSFWRNLGVISGAILFWIAASVKKREVVLLKEAIQKKIESRRTG